MEGENLRQTAQYVAAREAYYKAIEVNPANYYAHQELGDLYYQHFNDPGTALYHYRRYLEIGQRLNGPSFTDPTAETCIQGSKFKLAEGVVAQLARQRSTVEVDQLKRDNDSLRQQLAEAQRQLQLRALEARNAQGPGLITNPPTTTPLSNGVRTNGLALRLTNHPVARIPSGSTQESSRQQFPLVPEVRTYVIRSHDTPAQIARENGVKLPALMEANPGLDARRLKVGQTIRIPAK